MYFNLLDGEMNLGGLDIVVSGRLSNLLSGHAHFHSLLAETVKLDL